MKNSATHRLLFMFICCVANSFVYAQIGYSIDTLLMKDSFEKLQPYWIVEADTTTTTVKAQNRKLVIDAKEGATLWLNKKLEGNILIECTRNVIMQHAKFDRLSDVNFFWMSEDPLNKNLFTRKGIFKEYDSLQLYYAGIGGNNNTTTRFRKYDGNGEKKILQDYEDPAHLLQPNKEYHIRILVKNGVTALWVDEQLYFSFKDPRPLKSGYFAFRTTKSRQEITDFKIYRVK